MLVTNGCLQIRRARLTLPGTMPFVLTFSDPTLMDTDIIVGIAHASDLLLQGDENTTDAIAHALAERTFPQIIGTFRPLAAALFARFSVSDPDATAGEIANEITQFSQNVFGNEENTPGGDAIRVAGHLVASDFTPFDGESDAETIAASPIHFVVAVAQWIMTMSVILSNLTGDAGGDPIRWAAGTAEDPAPGARVILDPE